MADTTPTTWSAGAHKPAYSVFLGERKFDAVIIGGGLTGMLATYLLAREGKSVALLEKDEIGSGMTACTTAFLTQSLDTAPADLIKMFGKKAARLIVSSHGQAIDLIEQIVRHEKIECEFSRCKNYLYANIDSHPDELVTSHQAWEKLGLATEFKADKALGFTNAGYVAMPNQAKFHPLKFIYELAERAESLGAKIFEHSPVVKLDHSLGGRERVVVAGGAIETEAVLIATYLPFDHPPKLYLRQGTYVSYVLELEVSDFALPEGIYEDTNNPYHYFRVDWSAVPGRQRVIIGGEDHRKDLPVSAEKSFQALISYVDTIIPPEKWHIQKQWMGDILEPIDGLPSIGQINRHRHFYTVGFSGNGMTYAGIAAMMFRDFVFDRPSPWAAIYHPNRVPKLRALLIKGRDYAGELWHGAIKNTFRSD